MSDWLATKEGGEEEGKNNQSGHFSVVPMTTCAKKVQKKQDEGAPNRLLTSTNLKRPWLSPLA